MKREETPDYANTERLNKFQTLFYGYGCYHYDIVNIIIHIICIPFITFTLDKIIGYYAVDVYKLPFNPFYIAYLFICPFYIYVDPISGGFTAVQYVGASLLTKNMQFNFLGLTHIQFLWALHAVAWIAQFIGHGLFEGRKPALMDNIFFTISAPVFANIELLYYIFGYRADEVREVRKYIEENIRQYKASQKQKA
jgi:uncharacterized membrane protein YGL010W